LFLHAGTTYAAFQANSSLIDPVGFTKLPKDPLKEAAFLAAMPSPPFAASKLDSLRPMVNAALGVKPAIEYAGVVSASASRSVAPAPAPAPVVIVTTPAAPPPAPEVVEVPVVVPAGVMVVTAPPSGRASPKVSTPVSRGRQYRSAAEAALVGGIVQKLERRAYDKALADLDQWTSSFPHTEFAAERAYYFMLAYNGLEKPAKVIEAGSPLLPKLRESFESPMQSLSVVYLICVNFQKLSRPTREQTAFARAAAREMLNLLPVSFTVDVRPPAMSDGEWEKSRTVLETLARETMARATR
jgi:hypothetical protein